MKGRIHSFQSLGTVDGPGVRCVVFLQGCPLRCICCHNPDTWSFTGGEETDAVLLAKKILRYRSYFGTNGGVTLSGGEPLCQARFAEELFAYLKTEKIHTALDTSGCLWNDDVARLLSVTDMVLLDHKYPTEEDYRNYCGGSLIQTERFLAELDRRAIDTYLRRVIIPKKNDTKEAFRQLKETAERFPCVKKIELLPFRKLCIEKYQELGIPFPLADTSEPTASEMLEYQSWLYGN